MARKLFAVVFVVVVLMTATPVKADSGEALTPRQRIAIEKIYSAPLLEAIQILNESGAWQWEDRPLWGTHQTMADFAALLPGYNYDTLAYAALNNDAEMLQTIAYAVLHRYNELILTPMSENELTNIAMTCYNDHVVLNIAYASWATIDRNTSWIIVANQFATVSE